MHASMPRPPCSSKLEVVMSANKKITEAMRTMVEIAMAAVRMEAA